LDSRSRTLLSCDFFFGIVVVFHVVIFVNYDRGTVFRLHLFVGTSENWLRHKAAEFVVGLITSYFTRSGDPILLRSNIKHVCSTYSLLGSESLLLFPDTIVIEIFKELIDIKLCSLV